MAPPPYDTIRAHLHGHRREPGFYDLIITGDWGSWEVSCSGSCFSRTGWICPPGTPTAA